MIIDLTRMHRTVNTDELEQPFDVPPACGAPRSLTAARMHQAKHAIGNEPVVDEDILVDVEAGVSALEIARAVVRHAVAERQILRACRRSNRVGLNKTQRIQSARQGGWWKEAPRDRVPAQIVDGQSTLIISLLLQERGQRGQIKRLLDPHEKPAMAGPAFTYI